MMQVYAVKHKLENVIEKSRSGGIFTALSDLILKEDGIVYGSIMESPYKASHIAAYDGNSRDKMRGSKYIQSNLSDTFNDVKQKLESNKKVLFSGVPCQVAGLKKFLGRDYENLYCIDILCHGVPSPKIWKSYVEWQEKCNNGKALSIDFRDKSNIGWRGHEESITFTNGKKIFSKVFVNFYYGHNALRPSCYHCQFRNINRVGDISIADYWGIEKVAPELDDNKGTSLVLVNTKKGSLLFEKAKDSIIFKETKIEESMQTALVRPYDEPATREQFWSDYNNKNFSYVVDNYGSGIWK